MAKKNNPITISQTEAKVLVGFSCNNSCVFCHEQAYRLYPDKTTKELKLEIAAIARQGFKKLHLIGGEPTIRPDIVELVELAKSTGFEYIFLTTNGRFLAYENFARALIKAGISQIIFSLHGADAQTHDSLTQTKGSFKQAVKGIKNLRELGFQKISTNSVITNSNFGQLPAAARMLAGFGLRRVEFIYCSVQGGTFKKIVPRVSLAAPYILKALKIGQAKAFKWLLRNPPLGCYFFGVVNVSYSDSRDEKLFLPGRKYRLYHKISGKKILNYIKPDVCRSCSLSTQCLGVEEEYFKNYGIKELRPAKNG